jgi:putative transposase
MALMGVKFKANPTAEQKEVLSQWMGCARFVWNAKCEEQEYFYNYKKKFCSLDTHPPIDQTYAQFKSQENSPWLFNCPSILLRNATYTWKNTFSDFLRGKCGKPNKKRKGGNDSIWLTSELFSFEDNKLLIGGKNMILEN